MSNLLRFCVRVSLSACLLAVSTPAEIVAATPTTLSWTAPGDDGTIGRAAVYDLRYSTSLITEANFLSATRVTGAPVPQTAGSTESFTFTSLLPGTVYYVALRTGDEIPNWSSISNVVLLGSGTTASQGAPVVLSLSSSWPNPARTSATISYSLPVAGPMELDAFDVDGRHVRSITRGWQKASAGNVAWDLLDDNNRAVPPGVYFVRARLGGQSFTRRVIVTR